VIILEITQNEIIFSALQECQGKLVENASHEPALIGLLVFFVILFYVAFIVALYLERYKKFVKSDAKLEQRYKEHRKLLD